MKIPWPKEDPYTPRPTRMHGLLQPNGWTLKLYGVSFNGPTVDDQLLATAASAAERVLPAVDNHDVFGVGFVIAHQGQHAEWILVDWWQTGGVLAQHLLWRPCGSADPPTDAPPNLLACVWELRVTTFERNAWVHHVLADPSRPDVKGYLSAAAGDETT